MENPYKDIAYPEFDKDVHKYLKESIKQFDFKVSNESKPILGENLNWLNLHCFLENTYAITELNVLDSFPRMEISYRFYLKGKNGELLKLRSFGKLDKFIGKNEEKVNLLYKNYERLEEENYKKSYEKRLFYQSCLRWNNIAFKDIYHSILDGTYTYYDYKVWDEYITKNYKKRKWHEFAILPSFAWYKEKKL